MEVAELKKVRKRKRIKVKAVRVFRWETQKSINHINKSKNQKSWEA